MYSFITSWGEAIAPRIAWRVKAPIASELHSDQNDRYQQCAVGHPGLLALVQELVADYHFLQKHNIHTVADLQVNIDESKVQLSALERERSDISNRIRRPRSQKEQALYKEHRKAVSKQMKPIRERLRRAERILEKSPHLYELLKQEHELEKKARARYKERGR